MTKRKMERKVGLGREGTVDKEYLVKPLSKLAGRLVTAQGGCLLFPPHLLRFTPLRRSGAEERGGGDFDRRGVRRGVACLNGRRRDGGRASGQLLSDVLALVYLIHSYSNISVTCMVSGVRTYPIW